MASALFAQSQPGALEGTVLNSVTRNPVRKATVSMADSQGFSRVGVTDETGKFQIPNFSWKDVQRVAPRDADFRRPFENLGVAVEVKPGSRQTLALTAIDKPF
jgi:hypothetical protein